jgi:TolB protein
VEGNDDVYVLPADGGPAINVTHHPAEDRHASWSPDGHKIAFQSNRDGNWEVYTLELHTGELRRLTHHRAFDGVPSWSHDGNWILFASYRDDAPCQSGTPTPKPNSCPDLEIYRVPATGGTPERLTNSPGGDYEPVSSPNGEWTAFTSWRTGDKEIYLLRTVGAPPTVGERPTSGGPTHNFTNSAGDDWSPAWSADGTALLFLSDRDGFTELYRQSLDESQAVRLSANNVPEERPSLWPDGGLLFARYEPGPAFEVDNPNRPGAYHLTHSASGQTSPRSLAPLVKARHPIAAPLADFSTAAPLALGGGVQARRMPEVSWPGVSSPEISAPRLELMRLEDIQAPDPRLVTGVDQALRAWRDAVRDRSGHDYLGRVSDIFRPAAYYGHRLGYLSWHKTGRAVDLLFDWRGADGHKALTVVREDLAGEVYWRLFLRCAVQDGSQGEPLTQAPWHFWWHPDPQQSPETLANGGRRLPIPAGYFVDVTALAERYGWSRIASYHLDDFDWRRDSTATEYWHYQLTSGLTWYQAMSQIYPQDLLQRLFSRPVAASRRQSEEVMDGKGLPPVDAP